MSITDNYAKNDKFLYMLMSRLVMDCEYFLGFGCRSERRLWAGTVEKHIATMYEIWEYVEDKPEWLTKEQIADYANQMIS